MDTAHHGTQPAPITGYHVTLDGQELYAHPWRAFFVLAVAIFLLPTATSPVVGSRARRYPRSRDGAETRLGQETIG
jgi:hypothetical protein